EVLLQDQVFALCGALRLEERSRRVRPLVPGTEWTDDAFHVDDCLDPFGMTVRPIESERRSPIMHGQDDVLLEVERVEPGVEIAAVIDVAVGAVRRRARVAHADKIGREAASIGQQVGNDIAPEIGWRRIDVKHRWTPLVAVEPCAGDFNAPVVAISARTPSKWVCRCLESTTKTN